MPDRDYMILEQSKTNPAVWTELGIAPGATDVAAIAAVTADRATGEDRSGTFATIPARYWHPRTRAVKTVEQDVWLVDEKGPVTPDEGEPAVNGAGNGAVAHNALAGTTHGS